MTVLYTIIPLEYIFGEDDAEVAGIATAMTTPPEVELKRGAVSLIVQPGVGGSAQITRIISSNAQDYLNPEWQPGRTIMLG